MNTLLRALALYFMLAGLVQAQLKELNIPVQNLPMRCTVYPVRQGYKYCLTQRRCMISVVKPLLAQ